ncbi:hypothetical protein PC116_g3491 [Phytophthora cactorum]|uniref:Uncharacterized protein n=1 Tax=Phytophthora cactorum TaxID=29920 RepID=A0A329RBC5_9STRA|nr:hypothetical protein PC128_g15016 [Phytophthora cactorum]KAG4248816.1 hypothetical protein PC116_g3491 [Phytophthora cactorum]RAW21146.1 hypothetical protein PC110_g22411 [Phytophthora cactorum]
MVDFGLPARPIWFSQDPYPPDSSFRVPGSTDRNASPVVANTAPRQDATEGSVPAPTAVAFQGTQHGVTPVDTSTQVTRDPAYLDLSPGSHSITSIRRSSKASTRWRRLLLQNRPRRRLGNCSRVPVFSFSATEDKPFARLGPARGFNYSAYDGTAPSTSYSTDLTVTIRWRCGVVISRRSHRPSASKDETTFKLFKLQTLGHVTESDLEVRETRLSHYRRLVGAP